jgi:ligand-binding SRPBCC domain-containing protein
MIDMHKNNQTKVRTLKSEFLVPLELASVFEFFSDIQNLDKITPPWLRFRVLTAAAKVEKGSIIDYEMTIRGIPIRWQSEITSWNPPLRFVDVQRRGPYVMWIHQHIFRQVPVGTVVIDKVDYRVPGGLIEPLVHGALVGPDLSRIFAFRRDNLTELLKPSADPLWVRPKTTTALAGALGGVQ